MNKNLTEKHKKLTAAVGIILFIAVSAAVCIFIGKPMIKAAVEPDKFRQLITSYGIYGKAVFTGMVALQVFVAAIPGEPLEIAAGYAFGWQWGTLLCLIGIAVGGSLIFLFVRKFGVKAVEVFFSREKIDNLSFLHDSKKLRLISFLLFFIPGTPKDLISYFLGLTDMNFSEFLLISVIARIPSVITSTTGGNALGLKNYTFAVAVFAVTAVVSIAGIIIYKKMCTKKENNHDNK